MIRSLNLSPNFFPTDYLPICYELPIFPGGELHPKLDKSVNYSKISKVIVTHRVNCSNDVMAIEFVVDALRRVGVKHFELIMPYIPYARQDRYDLKKNFGESFTLKKFTNRINAIGFERIYVLDAHSDVSKALLDNCYEIENHEYVDQMLRDIFGNLEDKRFNLIAVDAGVSKKIDDLATYLYKVGWTNFDIVQCIKKRDIATGKILGFKVFCDDLEGLPCILPDDICDGGSSFGYASQALNDKNAGNLYGFFSHGIFSGDAIMKLINYRKIYTINSFKDITHPLIKQFKFKI